MIRPRRNPALKIFTSSTPPGTEVPPVTETPRSHVPLVNDCEGRFCALTPAHAHNSTSRVAVVLMTFPRVDGVAKRYQAKPCRASENWPVYRKRKRPA